YQSATDVINDLAAALSTNATDESEAIRESFLQAAQFVGRRTELTQMTEAMQHATDGKGSVWLVGGESGVGKSRLLEEVRTRALVDGALVMRGQAVLEGGGPYQVWRGPLELLLLYSDLSADEGAMMKMFVPDLEKMVGHTFADMPMTEPADMQKQMFDLIGKLIRRFDYPVMIVLEDMQWAGSESIQFLNYLTKTIISEAALVVVCSYRNDEAPDLPQRVTGASEIQLSRLGRDTMTALSVSMLGEQVRESSNLVDLIARETEGNPYFIVEVVRALAEEAGRLDSIRDMTLPTSVFAEGMKTVIQRRLQNVKPEYYPLLKLAAIAGRLLDLKLLTNLQPHMDLTKWLNATAAVSVVEVVGGQWRFAHDKLRERVLEDLTDHERPRLHRLVAETIEMCYPDDTMRAAALAYLWAVAGDAEKELHWSQVAAQNALRTNANTEAEHYYRRALELNDERYDLQRELEMQIELAVAMTATKGYPHPDVEAAYDRAHDLANHTGELS
ncbi:MAG: AAA family ATPase, partial [Chloroflexota bacterium]